jgi:hypothetical protein
MSDDELQRAYRRATMHAPPDAHPDPDRIADLVRGSLRESDRIAVLEHAMQCTQCRAELDLLRAASEGARAAPRARSFTRWAVLAAAAVVVLGVSAVALRQRRAPEPDVYRGERPGVGLVQPVAGAAVARPVRLAWHGVADARSYHVELLSARGDMIAAWNTSDTALAIPDSVHLDAGGAYDVWVRATLHDRSEVSSPIVRFTVK